MLKNIAIALLLIVSGLLGWQFVVQQQKLKNREKLLDYYLGYNHDNLIHFTEKMGEEIYFEVHNEGKTSNLSLKDTIRFMLGKHEKLIRGENLGLDETLAYEQELKAIWEKLIVKERIDDWPFPKTNWNEYPDSKSQKVRLMQIEHDVLSLMNGRIGVGGWRLAYYGPFLSPQNQDTIFLAENDTMRIRIGMALDADNLPHDVDFRPEQPDWQVSVGWVEKKGENRFWCFSKSDFAEKDAFEAKIYGRIKRATGGFTKSGSIRKIFKIVR